MTGNKPNLNDFKKSTLERSSEQFHKALAIDLPINRIPESTFINEILPQIRGENHSPNFALIIAAVSGSPFLETDIVDDAGNVLFRMPSLLERSVVDMDNNLDNHTSLASVFITAELLQNRSPRQAEAFVEQEINRRTVNNNTAEIIKQKRARWQAILSRYGLSLPGSGTVVVESGKAANQEKPELTFSDDDLL